MKYILLYLFLLLNSISYAGTIDPNTPDSEYTEYGSKFTSVVRLFNYNEKNQLCAGSAVVIDPHWIITAAHVVHNCHSNTISLDKTKYSIEQIIVHPDYKAEIFGYNDLALGYIEEDVNLDFYPQLYADADESDKLCSIAGYGITGTFVTGANLSDGLKRGGSNIIDHIERGILVCSPSRRGDNFTQLEFLISNGDSGGGLFINQKLAGINSGLMCSDKKLDSSYGDESFHTRISLYKKWIENTIKNFEVNK